MPDFNENGEDGTLLVEMGPLEFVPYSVHLFLETVRNWKGGSNSNRYCM